MFNMQRNKLEIILIYVPLISSFIIAIFLTINWLQSIVTTPTDNTNKLCQTTVFNSSLLQPDILPIIPSEQEANISFGKNSIGLSETKNTISFHNRDFYKNFLYVKNKAHINFAKGNYPEAVKSFQELRNKLCNTPETLIYLNNAKIGNSNAYTIAVVIPVETHPDKALEMLRGVAFVQTEINASTGIKNLPLRVAIVNSKGNDPKTANDIVSALAKTSKIFGVVGPYASNHIISTAKTYEQEKLVAITLATSTTFSNSNPYVFRITPTNQSEAEVLVDHMLNKLHEKKVAVLFNSDDDYSKTLKDNFIQAVKQNEGDIIEPSYDMLDAYDLSDPILEVSTIFKNVIEQKAKVLMLAPSRDKLSKIMEVVKLNSDSKEPLKLLAGNAVYTYEPTIEIYGQQAKNMVIAVALHNRESVFFKKSIQIWGAEVNWVTAMAADATQSLISAIKCASTMADVQKLLSEPKCSATGTDSSTIKYRASRDRIIKSQLVKIECTGNTNNSCKFVTVQ